MLNLQECSIFRGPAKFCNFRQNGRHFFSLPSFGETRSGSYCEVYPKMEDRSSTLVSLKKGHVEKDFFRPTHLATVFATCFENTFISAVKRYEG